jgi:lipopolysaccharide biosynthesis regulator YciM
LLSGQQDRAVDSFIEAVQNDPDTSELHFTLGNLFRKRGEYDRAVRVHEHLLARADLSESDRERAQFALAQDYFRAGLLDRAEAALQNNATREAQTLLLSIYERGRDWVNAGKTAEHLQAMGAGLFERRRAHYFCEQKLFDAAIAVSPDSPRAYLLLAQEKMATGQAAQAFDLLQTAITHTPQSAPLLASQWMQAATLDTERSLAIAQLETMYTATRSIDVLQTLIACGALDAQAAYTQHLAQTPSLLAAKHLLTAPEVQSTLTKATEPLSRYRCAACGFEAKQYFWQCPGCQAWDSYPFKRVEEL